MYETLYMHRNDRYEYFGLPRDKSSSDEDVTDDDVADGA